MQHSRRGFLRGLGTLLTAPAIVKASSLMAISPVKYVHQEVALGFSCEWSLAESFARTKEALAARVLSGRQFILIKREIA